MAFQLPVHRGEMIGESARAFRPVAMHQFHAARQAYQFGQFFAVSLVVAREPFRVGIVRAGDFPALTRLD
jgi:hypothetical protein